METLPFPRRMVEEDHWTPQDYLSPSLFDDCDLPGIVLRKFSEKKLHHYQNMLTTWPRTSPLIFMHPSLRAASSWVKYFQTHKDLAAVATYPLTLSQATSLATRLLAPHKKTDKVPLMAPLLGTFPWKSIVYLFLHSTKPEDFFLALSNLDEDALYQHVLSPTLSSLPSHTTEDVFPALLRLLMQGFKHQENLPTSPIFFKYQRLFQTWVSSSFPFHATVAQMVLQHMHQRKRGWPFWPMLQPGLRKMAENASARGQ